MEIRELIGKITLQENVSPIERNKVNGTFVIHIPNPLASYYSRFTEVNRPNSIVFVTKDPVSFERILRATKIINSKNTLQINSAKCEVMIGRNKYSGIRVMGIDRYTNIDKVQSAYHEEGFEFHKNVRLSKGTDALIRVNKFFNFIDVEDKIYQSPNNKDRFYFEVPRYMDWEEFRTHTFAIKNNISVTNYDIAKGIIYEKDGITDILRVIKPNITVDMVRQIREKYLNKLS
ncbi:hypothetical protein [Lutimonas zeaxanthinifaciens]|uniref:hypothetical protein n=1 Tax=Lutimonas zeaxanthinifaciens TaxID=3060215 RepID=UPI00265CADCC|nr:hypothetical protein [Lutimonas sp. YSD2104]WKK64704.1 hypothetical protein QZH61_08905 [Lutimonas sp. YSD2104]